jgi:hypothetical protein
MECSRSRGPAAAVEQVVPRSSRGGLAPMLGMGGVA